VNFSGGQRCPAYAQYVDASHQPLYHRADAERQLPDTPLIGDQGAQAGKFDVVLALDLDPPRRYAQELFWLPITAADPQAAMQAAVNWIQDEADYPFEVTGMVRVHDEQVAMIGALNINWQTPVRHDTAAGTLIRHPMTGRRVGFVANAEAQARHLSDVAAEHYCLVVRKPTSNGAPVCLAPLVSVISWS
jgi:hypothetical protein